MTAPFGCVAPFSSISRTMCSLSPSGPRQETYSTGCQWEELTNRVQDVSYLWRHVEAICREQDEAAAFDNMQPTGIKDFFKTSTSKFKP